MGLELVYERLALERITAENAGETVVEGTVALPERAGEIGRALKLDATPVLSEIQVKEDKVVFEGALDLTLLYVSFHERRGARRVRDDPDGEELDEQDWSQEEEPAVEEVLETVAWRQELPFVYLLDLAGVQEGDDVETAVEVRSTAFEVRSDRVSVDVDVVLAFSARAAVSHEISVAKGVRGESSVEVERRSVRVASLLGRGKGTAEARGELSFGGRPAPERLLEVRAEPVVTEAAAEEGRARVRGHVNYAILYVGEGGAPHHHQWIRGATFELEAEIPESVRGAACHVDIRAGKTESRLVDGDGEQVLSVRTPLELDVQVREVKEVPVVTGLQAKESEIAQRRQLLRILEAVGEARLSHEEEGALDLPSGYPGIERILSAQAKAAVDEVHVLGDKVAVELYVDVDLLYVGRAQGDGGVQTVSWPRAFELDLEIPLRGAEPGLERSVTAKVRQVQWDLVSRESIDVRVLLEVEARVSRELEIDAVVEAVEVPPQEEAPPTYTYVVVRPGDTVWKLAAYYRSHPEIIVAANGWLESEESPLPVGKKVCVPRKGVSVG